MRCEQVAHLLQDHLDGELLPTQRREVDAHLAECPPCRHLLDSLCELDFALSEVGEVGVSGDLVGQVMSRLPKESLGRKVVRVAFRSHPVVAAASFVMLLSMGVFSAYRAGETTAGFREVEITIAYPGASSVSLFGDFNSWDRTGLPMVRSPRGGWTVTLQVPRGVYHYNLLVDGQTIIPDPGGAAQVDDGFGGKSSVMVVEG